MVNYMAKTNDEMRRLAALAETAASIAARAQLGDPDFRLDGTLLGDAQLLTLDELALALAQMTEEED